MKRMKGLMALHCIWKNYIIFGILLIGCMSCRPKSEFHYIEDFAQGTTYHITYQGEKDFTQDFDSVLKAFDMSLSTWVPNSLISRIVTIIYNDYK